MLQIADSLFYAEKSKNAVIANQCAHWCGNPFSLQDAVAVYEKLWANAYNFAGSLVFFRPFSAGGQRSGRPTVCREYR